MDYIQLTLDDYIQCKNEIKENLGGIIKSFVRIGWQLTRINASQAYKNDGYNSITEFAKAEYDMNPDGVSRFMNVYERYSIPGDTPELQERYKDFKFAQLSEMLQLPAEDLPLIQPETKRADIRDLKKFNKENENNPDNLLNWQQDTQDNLPKTILEFFKANRETLNDLYGSEAYQAGNLKEMVEIVNPSGNRSFRKGTVFLMFYNFDKGIMVKEFGQSSPYDLTWERFFTITQSIFADAAAGSRTWEMCFGQKEAPEEKETENPSCPEDIRVESEREQGTKAEESGTESQKTASEHEKTEPETPKLTAEPQKLEESSEKCQKNAHEPEHQSDTGNIRVDSDFAPAQKSEKNKPECQETAQIQGQDSIENHPEYMPEPQNTEIEPLQETEIAPAQPEPKQDVLDKPLTRKEYLDNLTPYGAADCIAQAFKDFCNHTYSQLTEASFWEEWLITPVDHNGRAWID